MLTLLLAGLLLQGRPVEVPLPQGEEGLRPWKLIRVSDGKPVPCQVDGPRLVFLSKPGDSDYRLERGAPPDFPLVECSDDRKSLTVKAGGKPVLQYNHAEVEQSDPVFSRSGFIHPLWSPEGKVVTNDAPPNHRHHHGIWTAWTSSEFEGRKSSFWDSKAKQGKVQFHGIGKAQSGPVFGGFEADHRCLNLNGPDGPKPALNETWTVRVYALTDRFVVDLTLLQSAATQAPVIIKEYLYGGLGFRGPAEWEGKTGVEYLTSGGKGRVDGHATKAHWVLACGRIGGKETSVGFLGHPANFRHPQPMRIHPDEPFFNWAVPQGGAFSIEPGTPYVARYRFIVADGRLTAGQMDAEWAAIAEPPKITLSLPQ